MAVTNVWHECEDQKLLPEHLPEHSRHLYASFDYPLRFDGKWLVMVATGDCDAALPVICCFGCGLNLEKAYEERHPSIQRFEEKDGHPSIRKALQEGS